MIQVLPTLKYSYSDLEPYIDAKTMELHYTKHHQGYIDKLNAALEGTKYADQPLEQLFTKLDSLPDPLALAVRNHGGGHLNHSLFWSILTPNKQEQLPNLLSSAINSTFTDLDTFKQQFTQAAASHFGSGWAWLVKDKDHLKVITTPNQDSPLIQGLTPILGLDLWEHAYYLKYQNRRAEYIDAFWNIVNWSQVEQNLNNA